MSVATLPAGSSMRTSWSRTSKLVTSAVEARFWAKVVRGGAADCWPWTAAIDRGYGRFSVTHGLIWYAHRFAYALTTGDVPDDKVLDHLCRNRGCCNPAHLEPVEIAENVCRGGNSIKTHCPAGHPYSEGNTLVDADGWRQCRTCRKARALRYRLERHSQRRDGAALTP